MYTFGEVYTVEGKRDSSYGLLWGDRPTPLLTSSIPNHSGLVTTRTTGSSEIVKRRNSVDIINYFTMIVVVVIDGI